MGESLERLEWAEHGRFLRNLARSFAGEGADTDDLVQETWLRAIERPPRDASNPRGWLGKVLVNVFRERERGGRRRRRREEERETSGAGAPTSEVLERADLTQEPGSIRELYGIEDDSPSFARNCLLARRLVERGSRFVQLYHADWDHHGDAGNNLGQPLEDRCREVDRASAALVLDLEQRGLLEDTLVIWGGEFGRTPLGEVRQFVGRDHHIDAFTMWMAGGGVKEGFSHGETDEIGFAPVRDAMDIHDLHATIMHLLGIDHERLTFRHQGRDFRLTDVHGRVQEAILG